MIDKSFKIILLGAPGCGKGTLSNLICANNPNVLHLSTGNLFRAVLESESELGLKIKQILNSGELVSDDITNQLVKDEITKIIKQDKGFVLDGYPRTVNQAMFLNTILDIDNVFLLEIDENVLINRIVSRRICLNCNSIYNLNDLKEVSKDKNYLCKKCNSVLVQRKDDEETIIKNRINVYTNLTKPLIDYYKKQNKLITINANQTPNEIYEEILSKCQNQ